MTNEKFHEDLQQARQELSDAMVVVMELAKTGKAFGAEWDKALEREKKHSRKCTAYSIAPWFPEWGGCPGRNSCTVIVLWTFEKGNQRRVIDLHSTKFVSPAAAQSARP
jgi:hypothetical protein